MGRRAIVQGVNSNRLSLSYVYCRYWQSKYIVDVDSETSRDGRTASTAYPAVIEEVEDCIVEGES